VVFGVYQDGQVVGASVDYVAAAAQIGRRECRLRHLGEGAVADAITRGERERPWTEVALLAQSSAYLALELQIFAERLSQMPILCPESTYRRLFDSLVTFRRLLDAMVLNYKQTNGNENDGLVPALSTRMVEEIRYMLDREVVSGSGGSTISTARVGRKNISDAGVTK
jgi:hypothetical protein